MKRRKGIQSKLRRRIVLVGLICFFVSLLISLLVWMPSMRARALKTAENGNEEIISRVDSTVDFVDSFTENLALSVQQNAAIMRYFSDPTESNRNIAMLSLSNLTSYEGIVRAVFLEMNGLPLLDSLIRACPEDYTLLQSQWYRDIRDSEFSRRLSGVYNVSINNIDYSTFAYARNFYLNNRWCTFVIFTSLNDTLFDVRTVGENNYDYFLLRDSTGTVFYSAGDEAWAERTQALRPEAGLTAMAETESGTALTRRSVSTGWEITSFVSSESIFRSLMPYWLGMLISLTCMLLTMLAVLSGMLGQMLRPIVSLARTMDGAAKGNLEQKVEIHGDDEIGLLQQSYNKMLDDLRRSIDLIAEKERTEQQIRFSLLVSQIDPHFICNTINSINYLARKNRSADVVTVNTALMAILRDRLRVNDIEITDTVAKEAEVVEQYLKIQRFMYGGDLRVLWDIEPGLSEEQIPKNMIQPLVENALFHGLIDQESGMLDGEIRIGLRRTDDGLLLTVRDNGVGMEPERLQELLRRTRRPDERGSKIGLSNIRSRLYYLYGSADCLTIESAPGQGTTISIRFLRNL